MLTDAFFRSTPPDARSSGKKLILDGLDELTKETLSLLDRLMPLEELHLDGITSLSAEAAKKLPSLDRLSLNGLTKLGNKAAQHLEAITPKHEWTVVALASSWWLE